MTANRIHRIIATIRTMYLSTTAEVNAAIANVNTQMIRNMSIMGLGSAAGAITSTMLFPPDYPTYYANDDKHGHRPE
jgi:hypothetical protein